MLAEISMLQVFGYIGDGLTQIQQLLETLQKQPTELAVTCRSEDDSAL